MTRSHPKHRSYIRSLNCVACGAPPRSECAHIRFSHFDGEVIPLEERGGMGLKPHDRHCIPLCRQCHGRQHMMGEALFWMERGLNPICLAASLWANSGNLTAGRGIVMRAVNGGEGL